jgi:tungstate transport system substrate-binding protein
MKRILIILLITMFLFSGCSKSAQTTPLRLVTTTSVNDSGIMPVLLDEFKKEYSIEVDLLAVGTGQALELAKRGDADVLIVHSPKDEQQFIDDGYGTERIPFMKNYFVIAGPSDDPCKIQGKTANDSFKTIADSGCSFVSRADNSGTNKKELAIWTEVNVNPDGKDWYIKSGSGMGASLILAAEKSAYILTDKATFMTVAYDKLPLKIFVENDSSLLNTYSIIKLNPEKIPHISAIQDEINTFVNFITQSQQALSIIETYGKDKYGFPLFELLNN